MDQDRGDPDWIAVLFADPEKPPLSPLAAHLLGTVVTLVRSHPSPMSSALARGLVLLGRTLAGLGADQKAVRDATEELRELLSRPEFRKGNNGAATVAAAGIAITAVHDKVLQGLLIERGELAQPVKKTGRRKSTTTNPIPTGGGT